MKKNGMCNGQAIAIQTDRSKTSALRGQRVRFHGYFHKGVFDEVKGTLQVMDIRNVVLSEKTRAFGWYGVREGMVVLQFFQAPRERSNQDESLFRQVRVLRISGRRRNEGTCIDGR